MTPDDLPIVNAAALARGVDVIPSIFLAREYIAGFRQVVRRFEETRAELPAILGFSVEGPLLGNIGGVPPRGIWSPTADEWEQIATLGRYGLRYIVMGPDGDDLDGRIDGGVTISDIIDLCYRNGVRIALGHFRHHNPQLSADRTAAVIDYTHQRYGGRADVLLTDHLYNDMPRNFPHAWRSPTDRARRDHELAQFLATAWDESNLDHVLGPVPATLVRAARTDRLLPFLNFDGDHVDLAICQRTLEYLGPDRIIGITDNTEIPFLAGEILEHRHDNGLWYRSDGIVAAGSGDLDRQLRNLTAVGYGDDAADAIFNRNPRRALTPLPVPTHA